MENIVIVAIISIAYIIVNVFLIKNKSTTVEELHKICQDLRHDLNQRNDTIIQLIAALKMDKTMHTAAAVCVKPQPEYMETPHLTDEMMAEMERLHNSPA